jgi:NAD-dependent DNA ligase
MIHKFDGLFGCVTYAAGGKKLIQTRGKDGIGRVVTKRVEHVKGLPQLAGIVDGEMYVTGEFMIHKSLFAKHWAGKKIDGEEPYKSSRNFVGGIINTGVQTPTTRKAQQHITFIAHGLHFGKKRPANISEPTSKYEELTLLERLGFITELHPVRKRGKKAQTKRDKLIAVRYEIQTTGRVDGKPVDAEDYLDRIDRKLREGSAYNAPSFRILVTKEQVTPTLLKRLMVLFSRAYDLRQDGLVIECNDYKVRKKLKMELAETPEYARAVKLSREEQEHAWGVCGKLEWNYNKGGVHTPTSILKTSVELAEASCKRALAHNWLFVKEKRLGPGAKIKMIRAGDIIPYILEVKTTRKQGEWPTKCIWCKGKLKDNGTDLYCPNLSCEGLRYIQVQSFFSKIGVDQMGAGKIDRLWDAGFQSIEEIFNVTTRDLLKIEGFAKKSAMQLVENIQNCLQGVKLADLMHATTLFGDENSGLGSTKLQWIVDKFGPGVLLQGFTPDRASLSSIKGIGPTGIEQFQAGLPRFLKLYRHLKLWIKLSDGEKPKLKSKRLSGKQFVFTKFRDHDLIELIKSHGGVVSNAIKKTTTAVFSAGGSNKTARAKDLDVRVVPSNEAKSFVAKLLKK